MAVKLIPWDEAEFPDPKEFRLTMFDEGYAVTAYPLPPQLTTELISPEVDESLWLVKGRLKVHVDGQEFGLEPGDRLLISAQSPYLMTVLNEEGSLHLLGKKVEDS